MSVNKSPESRIVGCAAVLTDDIFFSSKIRVAGRSSGLTIDFIKDRHGLIEGLMSCPPYVIIVDLNCKKFAPIELITEIKTASALKGIPMIGYLPHVDTDLRDKARQAGCDTVLPRSRFAMEVGEILRSFAAQPPG